MSFHLLSSWAILFTSCSPVLHQLTMSSIHSLHGLFIRSIYNSKHQCLTYCCPPSCICSQTVGVSSEWLFVADPFQFWVCHIFHGLFFALFNWYVESFGNSTSQMPAVSLWSFCCMFRFHSHIALCWTLLFSIYVFITRDSVAIARIYHGNSVRLSVCLSVCLSHGWISQKRLKL